MIDEGRRVLSVDVVGVATELPSGEGRRFDDVLVDPPYVVAVSEDTKEERPTVATVVDLRTGKLRQLGGQGQPPLTHGGSWAVGGGSVAYPTFQKRRYCIAIVDLERLRGDVVHCAQPGHGLSQFVLGKQGLGFQEFDDTRPISCRAAKSLAHGGEAESFPSAEDCKPWEIARLDGDVFLWTEVPDEERVDEAEAYGYDAASGRVSQLGPALTGSVTVCGRSAYFIRDPQSDDGSARLLRFSGVHGLQLAYESKPGYFLGPPRCAADVVTITGYGDRQASYQVSARIE